MGPGPVSGWDPSPWPPLATFLWVSSRSAVNFALPPETTGGFSLGLPPSDSQGTAGWWFVSSEFWINFGSVVDIWCGGVGIFIQFCHWNNASDGPVRNTESGEGMVLRGTHNSRVVLHALPILPIERVWFLPQGTLGDRTSIVWQKWKITNQQP